MPSSRRGRIASAVQFALPLPRLRAHGKKLAHEGKCWDVAEKEFKLPAYENWPGYAGNVQFIARRYCALWGRGT
ncbi:MAG: hypothetical protein EXR39_04755 [Betaproteobacteria bacterium]|nr:hypothetical protein [Betaproteobacteria bacterium]